MMKEALIFVWRAVALAFRLVVCLPLFLAWGAVCWTIEWVRAR